MQNFDYLSQLSDFQQLYGYCRDAENFQLVAPEKSVVGARKALEYWVKMVYLVNKWDILARSGLMELISNEDFVSFVGDAQMMENIHFIRIVGNHGAHGQSIKPKESLHALACLYELIGEYLMMIDVIDTFPHFDATLVPKTVTISIVTQEGGPAIEPKTLDQYEQASAGKRLRLNKPNVLTEADTRRIFIDLMLREAGWEVLTNHGAILPSKACVEVPLEGMPNNSGEGFADYVLFSKSLKPLAVIEAKRTSKDSREGKHQAELYADLLEKKYGMRPVIYYSNGYTTWVQDGLGYADRQVMSFHTEKDLDYIQQKRNRALITDIQVRHDIAGRDYQIMAVHSICQHLNEHHRRGLLVMATGTGKTRVSISLCELIMRNNWAKNILFLADRRSLVKQAHRNYAKLLPSATTCILSEDREPDMNAHIMFSTYQTMIRYIDAEQKDFSIGRFDLIIIDEAHRSVFGKFGTIFDYFDSLLIGLTATPREEVDRSTYRLMGLEEGVPNFAYELEDAINDKNLVGYEVFPRSSKIMTEGIRYNDLTDAEKEELEKVWEYEAARNALIPGTRVTRDIQRQEIYTYIYNEDTCDKVLQDLMTNGLRIEDGETIGKSIIFACDHKHAQMIVDRFHALYPEKGDDYCVLIDNQVNYGQDLIDTFSAQQGEPGFDKIHIVVSVDMMDTGIDVPDCLNLVFFKPVHSKIKFNQMIGRGTRLAPNVFGPGKDKDHFLIFDWCGNFEYFDKHPKGAEPTDIMTLTQRLFNTRLDIAVILQEAKYQDNKTAHDFCEQLKDILHGQVSTLNDAQIAVRQQWELIDRFRKRKNWQYVSPVDTLAMKKHIAPLVFTNDTDLAAKKFDLLCLMLELSLMDETVNGNKPMEKVILIAQLLEKKASIPQVAMQMPTIREVQKPIFWENITTSLEVGLDNLERVRNDLRDLVQYLVGMGRESFDVDIEDVVTPQGEFQPIIPQLTYKQKVLEYLEENRANSVLLQKIYRMDQLSNRDIHELEHIFWEQLGTKEDYERFIEHESRMIQGGTIAVFLRSVIGIDRDEARKKFVDLIQTHTLTAEQEEYLSSILDYVCENGDISTQTMQYDPFSTFDWQTVYGEQMPQLIKYVNTIHNVIMA